jgi:hypothetical protein
MRTATCVAALLALALSGLAGSGSARAETLTEAHLEAGANAQVLNIQFAVRIQYLRHVPSSSGDLVQVFFQVIGDGERPSQVPEERRVPASETTPVITITYPLQPIAPVRKLLVRFGRKVDFRVRPGADNHSIEVILPTSPRRAPQAAAGAAPPATPAAPAPGAAAPEPAQRFALALDSFPSGDTSATLPLPPEFADFELFTRRVDGPAGPRYELMLGYFGSPQDAERARAKLRKLYPRAAVVAITQQPALAPATPVTVPGEAAPGVPAVPQTPTPVAPGDVEQRAAALLAGSRKAVAAGDYPAAIDSLNQLLVLPPNTSTQEAQEMIGVAREKNGEPAKARAEYQLYLKLYPGTEGARRVTERLARLEAAPPSQAPAAKVQAVRPTIKGVSGSLSQYYYDGATKINTAFNTPAGVERATLSNKDLSTLVTNLDVVGRYRNASADTRLVFRDTNNLSFISSTPSENRVNAAYIDYRGLQVPIEVKAGRQAGVAGGVYGLFDGAIAGYRFSSKTKINLVAGVPKDFEVDSTRYFYGLNVDGEMFWDRLSGNLFVVNQIVDDVTDRRAVGGELRYFDPIRTFYSLLDYDISYRKLNIGMAQGTWQFANRTTINALYDYRKAPTLTTTNALIGQPTSSIDTLLETMPLEQVRAQALALTADVTQVLLGASTGVTPAWTLGVDFRLTNIGALPAVNDLPATPSTGNIYGYSLQATGTNLYSRRDLNVFNLTLQTSPTFDGQYFSYSNLTGLGQAWTVEPTVRYYRQHDDFGVKLERITPGLRISYRLHERITLESELDYEMTHTESGTQEEDSTNRFFYVGYRLDF